MKLTSDRLLGKWFCMRKCLPTPNNTANSLLLVRLKKNEMQMFKFLHVKIAIIGLNTFQCQIFLVTKVWLS